MSGKISVILPTYNEKGNILRLVEAVHKEMAGRDHEILVVDDNSPDGTYKSVVEKGLPYVRAILRTGDRGLARSIRCGLENASGSVFVIMDTDFNHQPKYIPFMLDSLGYYGCVAASRFLYGGAMDSRIRHILSWLFNIFVRVITYGQITDSLYGYLAVKREVMERIDYGDVFWGYGDYCIRLMLYLQRLKVPILQFPAVHGRRTEGMGNRRFVKVFCQYFTEALKLTYRTRIRPHL